MGSWRLQLTAFLLVGVCQFSFAKSGSPSTKSRLLDTADIHRIYLDGDFEDAIDRIETALRYGGPFSHEDSVFIYKHLGVMYTAKYETREKGKLYNKRTDCAPPSRPLLAQGRRQVHSGSSASQAGHRQCSRLIRVLRKT